MSNSTTTTTTLGASGASKNIPRIVPWLNAEDWRQTRKLLYSSDIEEIRLGLLQAKIWMDRGKVPTAVESTVNFLETILIDYEYLYEFLSSRSKDNKETDAGGDNDADAGADNDADNNSKTFASRTLITIVDERHLRLAYNTAVIRFVNELVDRAQKSLFATSITKLAEQIGLPRVFVDIRHDGTHDKLNSLEFLRWAACEALKWLEDQYWSYEDDMTPATWLTEFNENVHGLFDQFCDQLEKINEIQSVASLEKNLNSRILSQIDFLQTLPRIMKFFLFSLLDYKRTGTENLLESVIKLLTRNNWENFILVICDVLLERRSNNESKQGQGESEKLVIWIVEEIKKQKNSNSSKIDNLSSNLLKKFSKNSSKELFNNVILKIWKHLNPIDEKLNRIFKIFESVYIKNEVKVNKTFKESENILKKRKYFEDENLEGWAIVNENWRQCPLGTIPK